MEDRGKEAEGEGPEEKGKAKEEGTPPRGRRARKRQQRRHDLRYDEGDQTKSSKPKKGRREKLYHAARARHTPKLQPATDACLGLERARQRGAQDYAPPVRRKARAEIRDMEARIPQGGRRRHHPGPERQATTQVRRVRPLQGPGRDQRELREQGDEDAGDEQDGLTLQKARRRREALAVRRAPPHEGGDARTAYPVPVDVVQAHQRRRCRGPIRRDPVPPEQEAERPEAPSGDDGPRTAHSRRQARGREEAQPVRPLRNGHRRLVDERNRRTARPDRQEEPQVRHRAACARHAGRGRRGPE